MRIALVGPCTSGKSVLARALRARGYDARQCSQEHSYVSDMWLRICKPDVLIYLDVSMETIEQRRRVTWALPYLQVLQHRLRHARQHCDLYIQTDNLSIDDILQKLLCFLQNYGQ